jgi:hypothetical protein
LVFAVVRGFSTMSAMQRLYLVTIGCRVRASWRSRSIAMAPIRQPSTGHVRAYRPGIM